MSAPSRDFIPVSKEKIDFFQWPFDSPSDMNSKTSENPVEISLKHTPGPWEWIGTIANPACFCYLQSESESNDEDYVGACTEGKGFTLNAANARLIAAAPQLLEALESCVRQMEAQMTRPFLTKARAAVAKAKGAK
jgi:hypothetical protein